jgi:hypothetical protein
MNRNFTLKIIQFHFSSPLYDRIKLGDQTVNSLLLYVWNISDLQKRSLWF